jgi:tRNA-dihydrouridine synthase
MLLDDGRAIEIVKAVRDALPPEVPTTVSLRRGFDDTPESTDRCSESKPEQLHCPLFLD